MLWGETAKDYEALRDALYAEWTPSGMIEEHKVDTLTKLMWRRRRVEQYWQIQTAKQNELIEASNNAADYIEYLRTGIEAFQMAVSAEEVDLVLSEMKPVFAAYIESKWPREKCEDLAKWGPLIATELEKLKAEKKIEGADQFVKIVTPMLIDAELTMLERLDLAIDRTLKSLMQIKSIKQILPSNMMPKAAPQKLTSTVSAPVIDGVVNDNVQNQSAQA